MIKKVDINCDMGEYKSPAGQEREAEIMPLITSCSVACGGHMGDSDTMRSTFLLAKTHQVKVGAHPSYPDPDHFGRKSMNISWQELSTSLESQITHCQRIANETGHPITHIKAHGALYNDIAKRVDLANSFVQLIQRIAPDTRLYCLAHSALAGLARDAGLAVVEEAFGDRRYVEVDRLQSRQYSGAVLTEVDDIKQHISHLASGQIDTLSAGLRPLAYETICVHSDTPQAADIIKTIRDTLTAHEIEIAAYQ